MLVFDGFNAGSRSSRSSLRGERKFAAMIDKLAWLHLRDGKLLGARSRGKDMCYVPGGKREAGESDAQALIREVLEELTVELVEDSVRLAGVFTAQAHGKPEGTLVKMTCYFADYRGELAPAAEIEELLWLTHSDRERCSPATVLILDWLHQQRLLSDGRVASSSPPSDR